jgi:hypothetical protein
MGSNDAFSGVLALVIEASFPVARFELLVGRLVADNGSLPQSYRVPNLGFSKEPVLDSRAAWVGRPAMRLRLAFLSAFVVVALGGCSQSSGPEQPVEPAAPRETVFDPTTSTIGRAQGVQQTVDEQAAEQRRRIEAAER